VKFWYFTTSCTLPSSRPAGGPSLSATRCRLFNIFSASLYAWRLSSPSVRGNSPYRCDGDYPPHVHHLEHLFCLKWRVHVKRVTLTCEICCVCVFVTICHLSGMYTVLFKKKNLKPPACLREYYCVCIWHCSWETVGTKRKIQCSLA
jgi:hypothetical protein